MVVIEQKIPYFRIVAFRMHAENVGCIGGQRAVNINRQMRNGPLVMQLMKGINDLLRAAYGKGGNKQYAAPIIGFIDDPFEIFFRLRIGWVQPVAIGAFNEENIRTLDYWCRIADDRDSFPADIATENEPHITAGIFIVDVENDMRTAQHVSGINQG